MNRKFLVLLIMPLVLAACDGENLVDVSVKGSNQSPYRMQILINGKKAGPALAPNSPIEFVVGVRIPSQDYLNSPLDAEGTVPVQMKNLETGLLTDVQYCSVGPRRPISVEYKYEVQGTAEYTYAEESFRCREL